MRIDAAALLDTFRLVGLLGLSQFHSAVQITPAAYRLPASVVAPPSPGRKRSPNAILGALVWRRERAAARK
jgi:hypothetical protein